MGAELETAAAAAPLPVQVHARTADEIVARVQRIQQVMKAVMKPEVHYGSPPGCDPDKPMLYKPGAEQLATTFFLAIDPMIEDLSTADATRYRISARVTHAETGAFLGTGVGECSSDEQKYRWRKAVSEEEYEATPEDRRRVKYYHDGNAAQVRTEHADLSNTILKMAKKRAVVDGVLTCTAASDCFGQDLEDMDPAVRDSLTSSDTKKRKPVKKPAAKGNTKMIEGEIDSIETKEGKNDKGFYTLTKVKVADDWYSTFSSEVGTRAMDCRDLGTPVKIAWQQKGRYRNIIALQPLETVEQTAPGDPPEFP